MTTYKTLAIVDDVHTCDCCGKSNLKSTVAMESDMGEIVHFGSVCATRHSGRDLKTIRVEAEDVRFKKVMAATAEYAACPEEKAYVLRLAVAHASNIRPGKEFANFVSDAAKAASKKRQEIAAKYNLNVYDLRT